MPTPTATAERRFPCAQCGAQVEFCPGAQALTCTHCGYENPPPAPTEVVEEQDFRAMLEEISRSEDLQDCIDVKCDACGAAVHGLGSRTALSCPYCSSNIVATAKSRRLIKPKGVLPFRITRDQAQSWFTRWLGSLWFAPGDLRRTAMNEGRLNGMYLPAWTFDSQTTTDYTGQRGDAYYVTVPYTAMVNGRPVTRTRQERRIRWSPAAGRVHNTFDDVLVIASDSLPYKEVESLEPWDLKAVVPYDDSYLSGYGAESYRVELPAGFEAARARMAPVIEQTIRSHIGGDEQRIFSIQTRHDRVTFKHILLPLWISAYRYRGRVYRFLVNARTGEVRGERPWSVPKITAAALAAVIVIALVILLISRS